ncbi:hypothetical protein CORC01_12432 [Colletotrichum orchidophilum]|uniref:BTB domain-containing protein n=1 Tax=Colletotrichum orchidophilum TaxID=1209926 RepID=A0A1G4AT47_9PEZI|nr:uncharacterized protein CORC01_12432 [Colletotrichum orchidophilum]OHE92263.1 hypothetical protein CORC01_12432 [Colletotrichum orchidophilum]
MLKVCDFRLDALWLAADVNKRAAAENRSAVVEIREDEFVHINCGDTLFVVFRDIITAGSMFFEAALFGFFREAHTQEISFDDIDAEALDFYFQLTHGWYFEIKFLGTKVVPFASFDGLINENQPEAFKRAHLEIPKVKLKKVAQVIILCDRFIHRSLLCIVRHMFLTLLTRTCNLWNTLKHVDSDWNMLFHNDFMLDYMAAFELFCTGHDDEHLIRNALTESFYWFSKNTPSLIKHFWEIMSPEFIAQWNVPRYIEWDPDDHVIFGHKFLKFDHARKLFITDQFAFENTTVCHKNRRFRRVSNMCSTGERLYLVPWVLNQQDNQIRVARLRAIVETIQRQSPSCFRTFIPGVAAHQISGKSDLSKHAPYENKDHQSRAKNIGGGWDRGNGLIGGRHYRGGHLQPQHGHHVYDAAENHQHGHHSTVRHKQYGDRGRAQLATQQDLAQSSPAMHPVHADTLQNQQVSQSVEDQHRQYSSAKGKGKQIDHLLESDDNGQQSNFKKKTQKKNKKQQALRSGSDTAGEPSGSGIPYQPAPAQMSAKARGKQKGTIAVAAVVAEDKAEDVAATRLTANFEARLDSFHISKDGLSLSKSVTNSL